MRDLQDSDRSCFNENPRDFIGPVGGTRRNQGGTVSWASHRDLSRGSMEMAP